MILQRMTIDRETTLLVRHDGDNLISTARIWHEQYINRLSDLWVNEKRRRTGEGKALVEACIHITKKEGKESLILSVNKNNEAAIALYRSMGFFVQGSGDDYLWMGVEV